MHISYLTESRNAGFEIADFLVAEVIALPWIVWIQLPWLAAALRFAENNGFRNGVCTTGVSQENLVVIEDPGPNDEPVD